MRAIRARFVSEVAIHVRGRHDQPCIRPARYGLREQACSFVCSRSSGSRVGAVDHRIWGL
jgi:hypothetical protein